MKAKQLMLKDWVKFKGHQCKVIDLSWNDYEVCSPIQLLDKNVYGCLECEPIPLTEEILKANAFEVRNNNTFIKGIGNFFVCVELDYNDIEISKYFGIGTDDEECEYGSDIHFEDNIKVHELQHALRLCGLDELADNFKIEEL